MRGAMLYGPRDVRFEERDAPTIVKPTDAIVRLVSPPPAADRSRVKLGACIWYERGGVAPTIMPR